LGFAQAKKKLISQIPPTAPRLFAQEGTGFIGIKLVQQQFTEGLDFI
jgi:hypothetical protein